MNKEPHTPTGRPSKTQQKKQMLDAQELAERLITLKDSQLSSLSLDQTMREAIALAKQLHKNAKSREGYRRQRQLLGKLIRDHDIKQLKHQLRGLGQEYWANSPAQREIAALKESLLTGQNSAIGMVISKYPSINKQKLRQLVKQAKQAQDEACATAAGKVLFNFLRQAHNLRQTPNMSEEESFLD